MQSHPTDKRSGFKNICAIGCPDICSPKCEPKCCLNNGFIIEEEPTKLQNFIDNQHISFGQKQNTLDSNPDSRHLVSASLGNLVTKQPILHTILERTGHLIPQNMISSANQVSTPETIESYTPSVDLSNFAQSLPSQSTYIQSMLVPTSRPKFITEIPKKLFSNPPQQYFETLKQYKPEEKIYLRPETPSPIFFESPVTDKTKYVDVPIQQQYIEEVPTQPQYVEVAPERPRYFEAAQVEQPIFETSILEHHIAPLIKTKPQSIPQIIQQLPIKPVPTQSMPQLSCGAYCSPNCMPFGCNSACCSSRSTIMNNESKNFPKQPSPGQIAAAGCSPLCANIWAINFNNPTNICPFKCQNKCCEPTESYKNLIRSCSIQCAPTYYNECCKKFGSDLNNQPISNVQDMRTIFRPCSDMCAPDYNINCCKQAAMMEPL